MSSNAKKPPPQPQPQTIEQYFAQPEMIVRRGELRALFDAYDRMRRSRTLLGRIRRRLGKLTGVTP
jgi:hypothetical protein